ncbi:MAG TPA: trypsin-like serine protease [Myxococcota bacterium]|nr:trypsin-like serine protease [Myxococcota bacterium]HRY95885.1 trypsin-like serine protease [Myxococcota bacterium]
MRRNLMLVALALVGAVAFQACGDGLTTENNLVKHQNAIYNGSPASGGEYDAVVSLHQNSRQGISISPFCSGTLITPNVVLTAAHCLKGTRASGLAIYLGQSSIREYNAGTLSYSDFYMVSAIAVHPGYSSTTMANDIALARLTSAVPANVASPVPALPQSLGFTAADEGHLALDFAGFGTVESGSQYAFGDKLHVVGTLDHLLSTDRLYYYQPLSEGGPCSGDSGGPAFVSRNGTVYVGGMTSYGDAACLDYGVSSRADTFESYINAFTGNTPAPDCSANGVCNAACAPGADPDCEPTGEVCGNGVCTGGETCAACAADCVRKGACCGDGVCNTKKGENATRCPADCQ